MAAQIQFQLRSVSIIHTLSVNGSVNPQVIDMTIELSTLRFCSEDRQLFTVDYGYHHF